MGGNRREEKGVFIWRKHEFRCRYDRVRLYVVLAACVSVGCSSSETEFRTGLESLGRDEFKALAGRRVGVVTNPTGVDRELRSTIELIAQSPHVDLAAVFGPEHGVKGSAQAGVKVADSGGLRGVPVYSLYGATRRPTTAMLSRIDVMLFDMQDVGVRTYTYVSTLLEVMRAAAAHGTEVWVLDRPVPIGGSIVEGPMPAQNYLATIRVEETGANRCHVDWSASFDLPEGVTEAQIAPALEGAYGGALKALKPLVEA